VRLVNTKRIKALKKDEDDSKNQEHKKNSTRRSKMKKTGFILALAGMTALTASAALYQDSFETGQGNWFYIEATNASAVSSPSAAVTDGSFALEMEHDQLSGQVDLIRLDHNADSDWFSAIKDPTATSMSVDIFLSAAVSAAGWSKVGMDLNGSMGHIYVEGVSGTDYVKGQDSLVHLDLDITSLDFTGATWAQVTLYFNGSAQSDIANRSPIYADNYQVVPEPATIGLMGLAAAALVAFRRFQI
jgi:hypothetical protein